MTADLHGTVAVVTGAAGGIGLATAALLQGRGARVALLDKDRAQLAAASLELTQHGTATAYPVDVTDGAAVAATVAEVTARLGPPSMLVNSVGWLGPLDRTVWEYTPDEWQQVFDVNLVGPMNCVRAVLPDMIAGAPAPARIVNVASMGGLWAEHRVGAYGAAKHALVAYTETLEAELKLAAPAVRVSLVCPGAVPTGLNRELRSSGRSRNTGTSPDWRRPEEIAADVLRAIDDDRFYVFTHRSSEERYRRYLRRILAAFADVEAP
jgi:NAD(P)-dependent dehydrogenase (short-subunit alcohol dehydrogenase family)